MRKAVTPFAGPRARSTRGGAAVGLTHGFQNQGDLSPLKGHKRSLRHPLTPWYLGLS
jgi:hypothetical protein